MSDELTQSFIRNDLNVLELNRNSENVENLYRNSKHVFPVKEKYTVSFVLNNTTYHNDGTFSQLPYINDQIVIDGDKATNPGTSPYSGKFTCTSNSILEPLRIIYDVKIIDWYSDSNCTTKFDFNSPITDNTNIYAKWEIYNSVNIGWWNPGGIASTTTQNFSGSIPTVIGSIDYCVIGGGGASGRAYDCSISSTSEGAEMVVCRPGTYGKLAWVRYRLPVIKNANLAGYLGGGGTAYNTNGGTSYAHYHNIQEITSYGGYSAASNDTRMNLKESNTEEKKIFGGTNAPTYFVVNKQLASNDSVSGYSQFDHYKNESGATDYKTYNRFQFYRGDIVDNRANIHFRATSWRKRSVLDLYRVTYTLWIEEIVDKAYVTDSAAGRYEVMTKQFVDSSNEEYGAPGNGVAIVTTSTNTQELLPHQGHAGGLYIKLYPAIKDYTIVDFCTSDGNCYIDTGIPVNSITGIECLGTFNNDYSVAYCALFGAQNNSEPWYITAVRIRNNTTTVEAFIHDTDGSRCKTYSNSVSSWNTWILNLSEQPFICRNAESADQVENNDIKTSSNLFLFGINNGGTSALLSKSSISYIRIYTNNGIEYVIKSAIRNSDNKSGYLKINQQTLEQTFLTSPTGVLTANNIL